jgi:two-component system, sensor histidine kinase RegB
VILIASIALALLYIHRETQVVLMYPFHVGTLVIFTVLNVITFWRLKQAWPVTDLEYFIQLLVDVLALTALLYFSGGATNPFVSYYLVPLTICAALLPWRYTWIIAGLSLLAYTLMLFYYHPLTTTLVQPILQPSLQPNLLPNQTAMDLMPPRFEHGHGSAGVSLHILGMWFNFALSACLITYFVVIMARALRQQEDTLASNREEELRDEQILAVATLAAGTAHELGTPLSTMTVLIDEMEQDSQHNPELSNDLNVLKQQVGSCRQILQGLVSTAEAHSHGQHASVPVMRFVQQIITRWQVLRPEAQVLFVASPGIENLYLQTDTTLEQAIMNLLNNAADACKQSISVNIKCEKQQIIIAIRDHGPGITLALAENIGKPFISTKGKGLGLGLFLTHATITRFGGHIELYNHPEGGTVARLSLPQMTNGGT